MSYIVLIRLNNNKLTTFMDDDENIDEFETREQAEGATRAHMFRNQDWEVIESPR